MAVTKLLTQLQAKHSHASRPPSKRWMLMRRFATLFSGVLAASNGASAGDLPEDTAEALIHSYNGGGVTATGPALLIRTKLVDKVSVSASYYLDSVSKASAVSSGKSPALAPLLAASTPLNNVAKRRIKIQRLFAYVDPDDFLA